VKIAISKVFMQWLHKYKINTQGVNTTQQYIYQLIKPPSYRGSEIKFLAEHKKRLFHQNA